MNSERQIQHRDLVETSKDPHLQCRVPSLQLHSYKNSSVWDTDEALTPRMAVVSWTGSTSKVTCRVSDHHNNLLSGCFISNWKKIAFLFSIKSLTVGKFYPPTQLPSLPYLHPAVSVARTFHSSKAKCTNKKKARAVKIDVYCPNILKHIRKGRNFSFLKQGLILIGVPHLVRPAELKRCVLRRAACCVCLQGTVNWNCVFKASLTGTLPRHNSFLAS